MIRSIFLIISGVILFVFNINAQTRLQNSSFEDTPSDATIPQDWLVCSEGTTPDILPGFWGVYQSAYEGNTYVGLITRPDGSFESLGQRLNPALDKEQCYQFSLVLAHSKIYAAYNKPLKLRIWISSDLCQRDQLIFETDYIDQKDWKSFQVEFIPKTKSKYIIFETYHPELEKGIKGNILIDNISEISNCGRA